MVERIKEKLEKLEELYQRLYEQANKDGKITKEEEELLDNIKSNIEEFRRYADQALEDNLITVSEHTKILQLQNKILRQSEEQALADENISPDEREILDLLINSIRNL